MERKVHSMELHSNTLLLMKIMIMIMIMLNIPQMIGYVKCFDNNKTMSFRVTDKNLLQKYTKIWKRASKLIKLNLRVNLFMEILINI